MRYRISWMLCLLIPVFGVGAPSQTEEKPKGQTPTTTPAAPGEEEELAVGKALYDGKCKMCHRADGKGTLEEMDLTDNVWKHGQTPEEIEKVIREGIKGTGMRAIMGDPTDPEIKALVKFVLKFSSGAPPAEPAKPPGN